MRTIYYSATDGKWHDFSDMAKGIRPDSQVFILPDEPEMREDDNENEAKIQAEWKNEQQT